MAGRNMNTAAAKPPANQQTQALSPVSTGEISARFMNDVIREYGATVGAPNLNGYQQRLIQGYFIGIDRALAEAEVRRAERKPHDPPINWQTINTPALFIDVVNCVRLGLDMAQPNHVYAIPYLNGKTGLYDVTLMEGYAGIAYVAQKYAADPPKNVVIQLVYSTDTFKPHMRDAVNQMETYEFTITNPFSRGNLVGGFGYIEYDDPRKNRLIMMSKADMDKRKPERTSAQFWGKWNDEMYLKTLVRHVYSERYIPRDPMKLDDAYQQMKLREIQFAAMEAEMEVSANANKGPLVDIPPRRNPAPSHTLPASSAVSVEIPASDAGRFAMAPERAQDSIPYAETSGISFPASSRPAAQSDAAATPPVSYPQGASDPANTPSGPVQTAPVNPPMSDAANVGNGGIPAQAESENPDF